MSGTEGRWIEHRLVPGVRARSTLRRGPGDDYGWADGAAARAVLAAEWGWAEPPCWLRQVHGRDLVDLDDPALPPEPVADAAMTRRPGRAAVVLTADCLPVFLATRDGSAVAVVHAGWRGLAAGVIEAAVAGFGVLPASLVACFGPAIGPDAFEVGPEVRACFLDVDLGHAGAFRPGRADRWLADLYRLAGRTLERAGVAPPPMPTWCTVRDTRFHSHRRDGSAAGRMAHLIWRDRDPRDR